jgi:hypothetical protein
MICHILLSHREEENEGALFRELIRLHSEVKIDLCFLLSTRIIVLYVVLFYLCDFKIVRLRIRRRRDSQRVENNKKKKTYGGRENFLKRLFFLRYVIRINSAFFNRRYT